MILFKKGVDYTKLNPILWDYLKNLDEVLTLDIAFHNDIIVTSLNDGRHSPGSIHYDGGAVDLRTKHLTDNEIKLLFFYCKKIAIKNHFQMIQVVDEIEEKVHIHIEMDRSQGQVD